jgi:K+-sensing histidine kinase KdpD
MIEETKHPSDLVSKNIIAVIVAVVVSALTAWVAFTYKVNTESALVNQQLIQMSTQLTKMDSKLENIQLNYAHLSQVLEIEKRVRDLEISRGAKK